MERWRSVCRQLPTPVFLIPGPHLGQHSSLVTPWIFKGVASAEGESTMNELVQLIMQKTGLPQDQAQEVVDTVVNHLKGRLPEALTSHLDAFLGESGNAAAAEGIADKAKSVVANLGGLFGKNEA
jgi:hypothetical protein